MNNNKDLLERLASLQIELTVKELERWLEDGDAFFFDPKVMAQVTTLLKHHEVKADLKEVQDLSALQKRIISNSEALLNKVNGDDTDEYVN